MSHSKLRRQIAWEAARLMYFREEPEYYRAKLKAARSILKGWVHPADLPSNAEIRDEVQVFTRMYEANGAADRLQQLRLEALWLMGKLQRFKPRLIGSVLTGHVREGSDIDLNLYSQRLEPITAVLDELHLLYDIQRKQVVKDQQTRTYTHIHIRDRAVFELTVYPPSQLNVVNTCSITGKSIPRASLAQLQQRIESEHPDIDIPLRLKQLDDQPDRFQVFESLLLPLESVKQDPRYHPEGDALYHSLQVFERARDQHPYDEEFLTAALLHDVGKAIDPSQHVQAGLEALEGFVTERTAWLIEHHMEAHQIRAQTAGARLRRRLQQHDSYHDLICLSQCDQEGRIPGTETCTLDEALDYLRDVSQAFNF